MNSHHTSAYAAGEKPNTFKEMQATGTSSFYSSVYSIKASPVALPLQRNLFSQNQSDDSKGRMGTNL